MKLFVFVDVAERFEVGPFFETQFEAIEWAEREWPDGNPDVDLIEVGDDED